MTHAFHHAILNAPVSFAFDCPGYYFNRIYAVLKIWKTFKKPFLSQIHFPQLGLTSCLTPLWRGCLQTVLSNAPAPHRDIRTVKHLYFASWPGFLYLPVLPSILHDGFLLIQQLHNTAIWAQLVDDLVFHSPYGFPRYTEMKANSPE